MGKNRALDIFVNVVKERAAIFNRVLSTAERPQLCVMFGMGKWTRTLRGNASAPSGATLKKRFKDRGVLVIDVNEFNTSQVSDMNYYKAKQL
jgi:surface protein